MEDKGLVGTLKLPEKLDFETLQRKAIQSEALTDLLNMILDSENFEHQIEMQISEGDGKIPWGKLNILPLPRNSQEEGAIHIEALPFVLSQLNDACDETIKYNKTYNKDLIKEQPMVEYQLRTVYLECLHSLFRRNDHKQDLYGLDALLKVVASKMNKIGFDAVKLAKDLRQEEKRQNTEFYFKFLDSGEHVLLTKGVVEKALLDDAILDHNYLLEQYNDGNLLLCEVYDKHGLSYDCYVLNTNINNRVFLDMNTIKHSDDVFNLYASANDVRPLSDQANKNILSQPLEFIPLDRNECSDTNINEKVKK